jgi:hypothetical protein
MADAITSRSQGVYLRVPLDMLAAVHAAAERDGLSVAVVILRALEAAGYGTCEPIRGRPARGESTRRSAGRIARRRP